MLPPHSTNCVQATVSGSFCQNDRPKKRRRSASWLSRLENSSDGIWRRETVHHRQAPCLGAPDLVKWHRTNTISVFAVLYWKIAMWQQPPGYQLPHKALQALGELELKMKPFPSAERLWENVFTEAERKRLGGDFRAAYTEHGTCGMWITLRGGSQLRGLIDSARAIGYLSDADYRWLLREIGESRKEKQTRGSLCWDRETRELRLGSRVIRRVRSLSVARNLAAILDAFQEAGWPRSIETPAAIDTSLSGEPARDAVRSLNEGLDVICFHADAGGQRVFWTRP